MVSPLSPLYSAIPKPPPVHSLRPRQSSYYHSKCCSCSHSGTTGKHAKTEPAALPPPSIPPACPRQSLKLRIPMTKGDNAAKGLDQSKSSNFGINCVTPKQSETEPAALPPPSIPLACPRPSLKIRIPVTKRDNVVNFPNHSKSSNFGISCVTPKQLKTEPPPSIPPACPRPSLKIMIPVKKGGNAAKRPISKPCYSADATTKVCQNSSSATELSGRKRKCAVAEKKPEFTLSLSKKEIEEDFLSTTGAKPPCRPTKRPKLVQEQLNCLFPGIYLSKRVTETQYKVHRSDLG